ncbi:hypothetical protein HXX76_011518 [Chlamydomonas incerta]|uniref:Protein kinase domain-containing protein n=1 Tax=Chlamydomonas incerta TaxID=51695 RepID=A0A835VWV3_CHLIN|nr:hypothetical protein HXX76_011518 [Chlamydomonas incerta]|eukprot:KAG2428818.1 hypothetical protein HXX76_011518 [Chlamydomonas incerta]
MTNYRRTNSPGGPVMRKPSLLGPRGAGSSGLISGGPEVPASVNNLAAVPLAAVQQLASGAGMVVSAASSFTMVRTNTVELASAHLPTLPSMAASMQSESRLLQGGATILTAGPDILSSILSEGCTRPVGSSFVASGELSRYQSMQGGLSSVLNADTGHVSTTAVEQLRQQLMCEQQAGLGGRPIEVDNLEKVGAGSFGVVYRGVWQGANVAIKYLVSSSTQQLQISATEALLSKLLAHPNVVQTFACKVVELTPDFFVGPIDHSGAGAAAASRSGLPRVHGRQSQTHQHHLEDRKDQHAHQQCKSCHGTGCPGGCAATDEAADAFHAGGIGASPLVTAVPSRSRVLIAATSGAAAAAAVLRPLTPPLSTTNTFLGSRAGAGAAVENVSGGGSCKGSPATLLQQADSTSSVQGQMPVLVPRGTVAIALDMEDEDPQQSDAAAVGDQTHAAPQLPLAPPLPPLASDTANGSGALDPQHQQHLSQGGADAGASTGAAAGGAGASDERLAVDTDGNESFQSGDGFGAPHISPMDGEPYALSKYRTLLGQIRAKPRDFLTQIIMEYCDRGSLQRAIDKNIFRASARWNARVALRAMLRTAREIAQGMCHLHASQIVHGDLKPANVLLKSSRSDRRGFIAKVADFGLSKIVQVAERGSLECDTDATGTIAYMAPEVLNGSLCPAADIYSFGVILWQLITGERPFADVHPGRMWVGVCTGALQLEWPADAHPMVRKLGDACMSFDKRQRPSFTKVARVLGVIETVVRNEGASQAAAAAMSAVRGSTGPDYRSVGMSGPMTGSGQRGHDMGTAAAAAYAISLAAAAHAGSAGGLAGSSNASATQAAVAAGVPYGSSGGRAGAFTGPLLGTSMPASPMMLSPAQHHQMLQAMYPHYTPGQVQQMMQQQQQQQRHHQHLQQQAAAVLGQHSSHHHHHHHHQQHMQAQAFQAYIQQQTAVYAQAQNSASGQAPQVAHSGMGQAYPFAASPQTLGSGPFHPGGQPMAVGVAAGLPMSPSCSSLQGPISETGSSVLVATPRYGVAGPPAWAGHRRSSGYGSSIGPGPGGAAAAMQQQQQQQHVQQQQQTAPATSSAAVHAGNSWSGAATSITVGPPASGPPGVGAEAQGPAGAPAAAQFGHGQGQHTVPTALRIPGGTAVSHPRLATAPPAPGRNVVTATPSGVQPDAGSFTVPPAVPPRPQQLQLHPVTAGPKLVQAAAVAAAAAHKPVAGQPPARGSSSGTSSAPSTSQLGPDRSKLVDGQPQAPLVRGNSGPAVTVGSPPPNPMPPNMVMFPMMVPAGMPPGAFMNFNSPTCSGVTSAPGTGSGMAAMPGPLHGAQVRPPLPHLPPGMPPAAAAPKTGVAPDAQMTEHPHQASPGEAAAVHQQQQQPSTYALPHLWPSQLPAAAGGDAWAAGVAPEFNTAMHAQPPIHHVGAVPPQGQLMQFLRPQGTVGGTAMGSAMAMAMPPQGSIPMPVLMSAWAGFPGTATSSDLARSHSIIGGAPPVPAVSSGVTQGGDGSGNQTDVQQAESAAIAASGADISTAQSAEQPASGQAAAAGSGAAALNRVQPGGAPVHLASSLPGPAHGSPMTYAVSPAGFEGAYYFTAAGPHFQIPAGGVAYYMPYVSLTASHQPMGGSGYAPPPMSGDPEGMHGSVADTLALGSVTADNSLMLGGATGAGGTSAAMYGRGTNPGMGPDISLSFQSAGAVPPAAAMAMQPLSYAQLPDSSTAPVPMPASSGQSWPHGGGQVPPVAAPQLAAMSAAGMAGVSGPPPTMPPIGVSSSLRRLSAVAYEGAGTVTSHGAYGPQPGSPGGAAGYREREGGCPPQGLQRDAILEGDEEEDR